jgi:hypothetical protein
MLFWQGEAEMIGAGSPSTWATDCTAIIDAWWTDVGTPWILVCPSTASESNSSLSLSVKAQILSMVSHPHVLAVIDMNSPSQAYTGIHYAENAGEVAAVAQRIFDTGFF